jgi:hypothetical protein
VLHVENQFARDDGQVNFRAGKPHKDDVYYALAQNEGVTELVGCLQTAKA